MKLETDCIIEDMITVNKSQLQYQEPTNAKATNYVILENADALKKISFYRKLPKYNTAIFLTLHYLTKYCLSIVVKLNINL